MAYFVFTVIYNINEFLSSYLGKLKASQRHMKERGEDRMFLDSTELSIDTSKPHATVEFTDSFGYMFNSLYDKKDRDIIILCIGTDRSTGDCLGPLIGYKLQMLRYRNIHVHGTLHSPVHAKNLHETLNMIQSAYIKPFIIAIDACLGKMERIGYINLGAGQLKPGAGVNKELPPVGDMYIAGIVNIAGYMEYMMLQNTRLSMVMKMADIITNGIQYTLWKHGY
ncbi:MAG: hypothetical protein PWP48_1370 [Clostridiales bacterium]|jgi:putative sporulation protein YyaC|nr:hypothetical protein [Clostridiales bacterium]MDK2992137.1 hypothetical protein [Clostridiales bacterium]